MKSKEEEKKKLTHFFSKQPFISHNKTRNLFTLMVSNLDKIA